MAKAFTFEQLRQRVRQAPADGQAWAALALRLRPPVRRGRVEWWGHHREVLWSTPPPLAGSNLAPKPGEALPRLFIDLANLLVRGRLVESLRDEDLPAAMVTALGAPAAFRARAAAHLADLEMSALGVPCPPEEAGFLHEAEQAARDLPPSPTGAVLRWLLAPTWDGAPGGLETLFPGQRAAVEAAQGVFTNPTWATAPFFTSEQRELLQRWVERQERRTDPGCPYRTLRQAFAAGWREERPDHYGGQRLLLKGHRLIHGQRTAQSRTAWAEWGYEVPDDAPPHAVVCHKVGRGRQAYDVYRLDQVRRVADRPVGEVIHQLRTWNFTRPRWAILCAYLDFPEVEPTPENFAVLSDWAEEKGGTIAALRDSWSRDMAWNLRRHRRSWRDESIHPANVVGDSGFALAGGAVTPRT